MGVLSRCRQKPPPPPQLQKEQEQFTAVVQNLVAAPKRPDCTSVLLQVAQQLIVLNKKHVTHSHISDYTWLQLNLDIDPFSTAGSAWLNNMRRILDEQAKEDGCEYYLAGGDVAG